MRTHTSLLFVLLVVAPGCAAESEAAPAALAARLADAEARLKAEPCVASKTPCPMTSFVLGPADFAMPHSTGEAILVVDTFTSFPAFSRSST